MGAKYSPSLQVSRDGYALLVHIPIGCYTYVLEQPSQHSQDHTALKSTRSDETLIVDAQLLTSKGYSTHIVSQVRKCVLPWSWMQPETW